MNRINLHQMKILHNNNQPENKERATEVHP